MTIFVVPDIHGEYEKLLKLMGKIHKERKQEDKIVFLGDYIDRGKRSKDVVNYIFDLKSNDDNVILLRGNHDDEFYNIIENVDHLNIYQIEWLSRYCLETLNSYGVSTETIKYSGINENLKEVLKIIKNQLKKFKESEEYRKFKILMVNCQNYHKEGNYIFTHSGGVHWKPINEQTLDQLLWSRDFQKRKDGFTHVCGHTPTISGEVEEHNDMLLCDVGAVFKDIDLPFIKLSQEGE